MTLGRSVTLNWAPPDDDGGCKVGNYIVEYYRVSWPWGAFEPRSSLYH